MPASAEDERRHRLRRLDDCLSVLEREHERNRTRVSIELAAALHERAPTVRQGMLIVDAIDEVLREQQPLMVDPSGTPARGSSRTRRSYLPRDKREDYDHLDETA